MDKKLRGRIHNILRNDFKKSKLYSEVLEKAKLDVKVYKCEECGQVYYTGVSEKNFEEYKNKYPGIIAAEVTRSKSGSKRAKNCFEVDHKEPVIPYDKLYYEVNLEEWVDRLYCDINNLACLCTSCHKEKTSKEATIRSKYKKLKKLE